jgi:predicted transposase
LRSLEKERVGMQTTLTAKLKLLPTSDQFAALRQTQLAYRDALNYVSQYAFAHGKTSNGRRLQDETYATIRAQFGLPAQMACNVPRQVSGTYKGLWTKVRKNAEARRLGYTRKRYKGLDEAPHYVSPTLTYNVGRDYSLKAGQQVSVLTLVGRIIVPYQGYDRHVALLHQGATIGAARLWYDRSRKRFYLLIALEVETPDPAPEQFQQVVGVDVGQRYLATVATTTGGAEFYSGKQVRAKADHYARLRKRLQLKGTRSATRKLVALSGRERRLQLNTNHVISRRMLDTHHHSLVGLEDLTGIRERTKCRKKRRKGNKLVPVSVKARKANRHASIWAFAELHGMLAYKAILVGSLCVKVDAHHTSQQCPRCGHTSPDNRPHKGLLFVCQNPKCHYTLHADLIGARNIALRTLLVRQDWISTGSLSVSLDGADEEAKAARRQCYAELRWSLAPSSSPLRG